MGQPQNITITKYWTAGDTLRAISDILVDGDGKPVDLSAVGTTVAFRLVNDTTGAVVVNNAAATIVSPATDGKVRYDFQVNELTAGIYSYYWIVSLGGETEHYPGDGPKRKLVVYARP